MPGIARQAADAAEKQQRKRKGKDAPAEAEPAAAVAEAPKPAEAPAAVEAKKPGSEGTLHKPSEDGRVRGDHAAAR